jgi:glycosyltransferase involved in cell wall biosynthesis
MRIAYVTDAVYPYHKGGKETRLYEISKRLAQSNSVHIYTMKWWNGPDSIIKDGVHFHSISSLHKLYTSSGRRSILEGIIFGINCLKIDVSSYDVVDVDHMPFFPLFSVKLKCLFSKKKMHATWHEVWGRSYWKEYLGGFGIFGYWIEKMAVKMPDKIIAVSEHTKKRLENDFKVRNVSYVPNGVDYSSITKVKPSTEKSDVIFAGRLLSNKNVDVLIKAIKINPVKTIIIGDGPELNRLKKLTRELKLEKFIVFKGFVKDKKKVYSLMKSSRVFVLPSSREGFGIVVLEANACGLPVITVNSPDNAAKELIGKNGIVCRLDEKEIAKSIENAFKIKKISAYDKKYDWDKISKQLTEVFR